MEKEYEFRILKNYPFRRAFVIIKEKDSFLSSIENMLLGG